MAQYMGDHASNELEKQEKIELKRALDSVTEML
jgi:hypothetical protein